MTKRTRRSGFYPVVLPPDAPNCKLYSYVLHDGTCVDHVYLDIADMRERERLIMAHYLRHMQRFYVDRSVQTRVVTRDDPWDFELETALGESFNVEIVSIANDRLQFERGKREERLSKWSPRKSIPLKELEKLLRFFPNEKASKEVESLKRAGVVPSAYVENPFYRTSPNIIVGARSPPTSSYTELIQTAIEGKESKPHSGKERTALIIDNRASLLDIDDYWEAVENLEYLLERSTFMEIWFYTGYWSDDSGEYAEFSFAPMKVSPERREVISAHANREGLDEFGRLVWGAPSAPGGHSDG